MDSPAAPPPAPNAGASAASVEARVLAVQLAEAKTRPLWRRLLWLGAGLASLVTGAVGIFLPLLPTTPFVLLAAFCFARSSSRCERWLLEHPKFGPMIRQWRARRAIPRRAKQLAWTMMSFGCAWAAWVLPGKVAWVPAACCMAVAFWMWRLPDA